MTLNNNLYNIINTDTGKREFEISMLQDCVIYKAHFPGMPVTPGVCMVQIAGELLEELLGKKLSLKRVVNAKFLNVVDPSRTPRLIYAFKKIEESEDGAVKITVHLEYGDIVFAKMTLEYKKRV